MTKLTEEQLETAKKQLAETEMSRRKECAEKIEAILNEYGYMLLPSIEAIWDATDGSTKHRAVNNLIEKPKS